MTRVLVATLYHSHPPFSLSTMLTQWLVNGTCGFSLSLSLSFSLILLLTLSSHTHSGSSCSFGLLAVLVPSRLRLRLLQSCSTFAFCTSLICICIVPVSAPHSFFCSCLHTRLERTNEFRAASHAHPSK
ncbi:hypothetical protein LZ30DRAFT_735799 [Colletotrichum cereale]|nr:hypothetical protein LZ30DRAFT_735799 [Colletotrichum cereale]